MITKQGKTLKTDDMGKGKKGTDSARCLHLHSSPLDVFGIPPKALALELNGEGRLNGENVL